MPYFNQDIPDVVIKSLFKKYDKDNSGFLDRKELSSLLKDDLGLTADQAEVYIHLLDQDGDAKTSPEEFCAWLRRMSKAVEMFRKYDRDGSQCISRDEFTCLLTELGCNVDVNTAFRVLDADGNGKISFPEFLKWLNWVPFD